MASVNENGVEQLPRRVRQSTQPAHRIVSTSGLCKPLGIEPVFVEKFSRAGQINKPDSG
jgi:hypothetical protein